MTLQFEGVGFGTGTGAGGKIGTVVLVAMGSQPSTPYTVGSKWFYNGKIYTATSTSAHNSGVVPSYDTAYLFNGTYYYWDGSALQGADESNLVHITGTETITGDKTFSGSVALGDNASAQTKPTSDTSDAVATTKFVKDFAQDGEWQKPADWVNIRSGALDNSIYFLVGHSKPTGSIGSYKIATWAKFSYRIGLSNSSNTYDVFVDGVKVATTASETATEIDWATLYNNGTIKEGFDTSSYMPEGNFTTHIVRFTPTNPEDNIVTCRCVDISGQKNQGMLWIHLEINNAINIFQLIGDDNCSNNYLKTITAKNDKIIYKVTASGNNGLYAAFYSTGNHLYKIPTLEAESNEIYGNGLARRDFGSVLVKKITIKNNSELIRFACLHGFLGEEIDFENPIRFHSGADNVTNASGASNLKRLPKISTKEKGTTLVMDNFDSLEPTFIDESFNELRTLLRIDGNSTHITNIVGLVVSSSAPFNYATAPQISVRYTNMNRDALVRLFNSIPTVSDSQEIDITGATGAGDLTAEDIAIATGKGWTVTR